MADLQKYITATGVIVPDTSTIKTDVENEYKSVYGSDFVIDPSSEQGREIDAEVTARISVLRNNAEIANQINPNYAEGIFLDAIYAISNGERDIAERSTVICKLAGVNGTIIPKGSKVRDDNSNLWELNAAAVIPATGFVYASFFSVEFGAITAAIGEVNTIVDGQLGWETVTNETAAVPGKLQQSDLSTRSQRKLELAGNTRNNTYAIITAISKVENVASLSFRENNSASTLIIDGVTMVENSTYVCVDGGANLDIAEAYYNARSGGTAFNGNTTINVTDPESLQVIPVKFDRPEDKPKLVRITVKISNGADPTEAVKKAVVDYANGFVVGERGFVVGGDVSAFEIASAVNVGVAGVFVSKCEIAENELTPTYTTDTIKTEIFEKASITENDVQVIIL